MPQLTRLVVLVLTMQEQILYTSILSLLSMLLALFLLHAYTFLSTIPYYVYYDQHKFLATTDHNMMMFSKIVLFLQNQFTYKLIVTSFLNRFSQLFQQRQFPLSSHSQSGFHQARIRGSVKLHS